MRRRRACGGRFALPGSCALSLALLLAACGAEDDPRSDPAYWHLLAERAFGRGDEAARQADAASPGGPSAAVVALRADACGAWREAARGYRNVFRLTDPVPELRNPRAQMAFRTARSFSKAARYLPAAPESDDLAAEALFWLERAEELAPALRQVHYERARLYDSEVAGARDLESARVCYARYLAAVDGAEGLAEGERERAELARRRVGELAGPGR